MNDSRNVIEFPQVSGALEARGWLCLRLVGVAKLAGLLSTPFRECIPQGSRESPEFPISARQVKSPGMMQNCKVVEADYR